MPLDTRFSGPSLTQLGKLAGEEHDPQLKGDHSIALNLGHDGGAKLGSMGIKTSGVSMPTNTNTNTTPSPVAPSAPVVPVVTFPTSGPNAGATPTIAAPGVAPGDVIKAASALATEDEWNQYMPKDPEHIEYIKGPDGVVRPTMVISGANIVGPTTGSSGGAGAPPPMPPPEPTRPPLVSAGPVKKSSAWLWLALAAAAAALFT